MSEPVFPFSQYEAAIQLRQKLLAEAIRNGQQDYQANNGSMVSGHYVAPSWAQNLSGALKPRQFLEDANRLQQMQQQYANADQAAAMRHQQQMPVTTPERSGPVDPNNPQELAPIVPSSQDKMNWAQKGMAIPSRKALLSKFLDDQLLEEPVRAEQRVHQKALRDDALKVARERNSLDYQVKMETLEDKRKGLEATLQQRNLDREYRADIARQHNETLLEIARMKGAATVGSKPTAAETKADAAQTKVDTDAKEAISLLDDARKLIPGATGSYLGTAADEVGRFFGAGTGGAQKDAQLKTIAANLILKMPKLSGPQSDRDVNLYREAAGQLGDRTLPSSVKKAAVEQILDVYRRNGYAVPDAPATETKKPAPKQSRRETISKAVEAMDLSDNETWNSWGPSQQATMLEQIQKMPPGTVFTIGKQRYVAE